MEDFKLSQVMLLMPQVPWGKMFCRVSPSMEVPSPSVSTSASRERHNPSKVRNHLPNETASYPKTLDASKSYLVHSARLVDAPFSELLEMLKDASAGSS